MIKIYALSQFFQPTNTDIHMTSSEKSFDNFLKADKKQLLNTNLLFGLNLFIQFYRIGFNNKYNTVPEEFLGLINENNFNVQLTKGILKKGKNTYYIVKADMKNNHTAFPIWSIYLSWSLVIIILLIISYLL